MKKIVSVILSVVMAVSCMTVGMISTEAATKVPEISGFVMYYNPKTVIQKIAPTKKDPLTLKISSTSKDKARVSIKLEEPDKYKNAKWITSSSVVKIAPSKESGSCIVDMKKSNYSGTITLSLKSNNKVIRTVKLSHKYVK